MKKKIVYTKAPKEIEEALARAIPVDDFLPPPYLLLARDPSVKVTLALGKNSVEFFKKAAKENGVPYQTMIRKVVDLYAKRHMRNGA
jgi:hypothetical protein